MTGSNDKNFDAQNTLKVKVSNVTEYYSVNAFPTCHIGHGGANGAIKIGGSDVDF